MQRSLVTHNRYSYSPIHGREDYSWPDGKRLAVYLGFNIEHFEFGKGLGAKLAPSGEPDILNYSWRDYGNRVGVWRCRDLFDELKLPMGVLINTALYDYCPDVVASFRKGQYAWGAEIIGHGHTNAERQSDMKEADEVVLIRACTERIKAEEGVAPRGWLSPWIAETAVTPDLLKEAGYTYNLNWCHDDMPGKMATRAGDLWTIPYPQEINDIPAIIGRQCGAEEFAGMIIDCYDEMIEQSKKQPLVMGIALHPYLVGQPHRLRQLRRALKHICDDGRAWWTTPGAIYDHVSAQG
jgi:peptidoglycan/xylan/chitin deacetylase (PgdA/CDA1 family)